MKKMSIEEQISAAINEFNSWPQSVKDATEFKASAPYYNESIRENIPNNNSIKTKAEQDK